MFMRRAKVTYGLFSQAGGFDGVLADALPLAGTASVIYQYRKHVPRHGPGLDLDCPVGGGDCSLV